MMRLFYLCVLAVFFGQAAVAKEPSVSVDRESGTIELSFSVDPRKLKTRFIYVVSDGVYYRVFRNRLVKNNEGMYRRVFIVSSSSCKVEGELVPKDTKKIDLFAENLLIREYSLANQQGEIRWELTPAKF